MDNETIIIPKIKIHPSKIILYNEFHNSKGFKRRSSYSDNKTVLIQVEKDGKIELKRISKNFINSERTTKGYLSKQGTKKLSLAIEYLLHLNKPNNGKSGNTGRHYKNKITFITLTLPSKQLHTDKEIKDKLLNQFLIEITKYHKVTQYVWRAEYQQNGNIHFHILTNRFIAWNDVRNRWNRIINKLQYVDNYRKNLEEYHKNGFQIRKDLLKKWPIEKQYQAYKKGLKTDWNNPNSIDIHGIQNITNILKYLTKYLSKNEQSKEEIKQPIFENRKSIGRVWSSSQELSKIQGATTEIDSLIEENLEKLKTNLGNKFFHSDYFTIINVTLEDLQENDCKELLLIFYRFIYDKFQHASQIDL